MSKQLLFCIETNKKADTDWKYINDTIRYYYQIDLKTRIRPIYMGTKYAYNSKKVITELNKWTKDFKGETTIIYCIDTDHIDNDPSRLKEFNEITKYCKDHCYQLISFCLDIEDVYLGEQINNTDKVKMAKSFSKNGGVVNLDISNLMTNEKKRHKSNILLILDGLLERK